MSLSLALRSLLGLPLLLLSLLPLSLLPLPLLLLALPATAQNASAGNSVSAGNSASASNVHLDGRLILVLPFENQSTQPGLDWIGESFPTLLNERLRSVGFLTIRREDRQYALQHLGLPKGLHPTHATIYRIAQTLDVDDVILGTYSVEGGKVTATAQIFEMHGPSLSAPLTESASLNQLLDVEDGLAWQIAKKLDLNFAVEKQTFLAAGHGVRLDTFENYIRGVTEPGATEQIRHLNLAVQLSPDDTAAWLALGKAYFADQQNTQAIHAFSKIPPANHRALEAQFYSGLADLYTGQYPQAQTAFSTVAAVLPLPEVLNNEGIALNRQGQDGTSLIARAVQLDPQNANEWFNLAVSERRAHHPSQALDAIGKALALQPNDAESLRLKQHLLAEQNPTQDASPIGSEAASPARAAQDTASSDASNSSADADADTDAASDADASSDNGDSAPANASDDNYEPLERIARRYNETSFRQAAFEMEQMRAIKLRSLPPLRQATELCKEGQGYLHQGLLLEAEREFQQALVVAPGSAEAHAGLAQIRAATGNTAAARQQANAALQLAPNNIAAQKVLQQLQSQQKKVP